MGIREIIEKLRLRSIFNKVNNQIFIRKEHPTMNLDKLNNVLPTEVQNQLTDVVETYKINTPLRLSHFLAQCAHESGNWKFKVENLNYSAQALQSVFRKYFPNEALASQHARKPEMIANVVYANRMNNGGPETGDGWSFRGRGYIQLTGRQNYSLFNETVEEDLLTNPDLVAEKYPLLSAAWFWDTNNLNNLADAGSTDQDITKVTRRVNGGTHGLDDRIAKFKTYFSVLQ